MTTPGNKPAGEAMQAAYASQTSGSVPDEIKRAIDEFDQRCKDYGVHLAHRSEGQDLYRVSKHRSAARVHLDALIMAYVKPSAAVIQEGWPSDLVKEEFTRVYEAYKGGLKDGASNAVIPPGWIMTLIEPTQRMMLAGIEAVLKCSAVDETSIYKAMCAASPTHPAITLADIVAVLMSEEVRKNALIAFWEYDDNGDMRDALRVAAEAVLKMGAK